MPPRAPAAASAAAQGIAAPAPELRDEMFPLDASGRPFLGEAEPAFEAANVLRSGRDLDGPECDLSR